MSIVVVIDLDGSEREKLLNIIANGRGKAEDRRTLIFSSALFFLAIKSYRCARRTLDENRIAFANHAIVRSSIFARVLSDTDLSIPAASYLRLAAS